MSIGQVIFGYKLHYIVAILSGLFAYYKYGWNYDTLSNLTPSSKLATSSKGLFTADELAQYDGGPSSKGLYISILGSVYDVERGAQHYGPGGSYFVFAAKDASKAFITGEFEGESDEELDDVLTLTGRDLMGLKNWRDFYEKSYVFKGYLIGRFYTETGEKTAYHQQFDEQIADHQVQQAQEAAEQQHYPPCNVEWNADLGTRVWCTTKSGGISRDWVGVPRQYYKEGHKDPVCVCVQPEKVDQPIFRDYKKCDKLSESCYASEEEM